jgi:hypothetical protein
MDMSPAYVKGATTPVRLTAGPPWILKRPIGEKELTRAAPSRSAQFGCPCL